MEIDGSTFKHHAWCHSITTYYIMCERESLSRSGRDHLSIAQTIETHTHGNEKLSFDIFADSYTIFLGSFFSFLLFPFHYTNYFAMLIYLAILLFFLACKIQCRVFL